MRAWSVARLVAQQSELPVLIGDTAELERIARSALAAEDVVYVVAGSQRGGTAVTVARTGFDTTRIPPPRPAAGARNGPRSDETARVGPGFIEVAEEIRESNAHQVVDWDASSAGASLGEVRLGLSTERQTMLFRRLSWTGLLASALMLGAILKVQQRRMHKVLGPLRNLIEFTRQVSRGDLSRRAAVVRRDEIGELAAACNEMVEALGESRRKLVEALEGAEETSRLKSEFLANMSHEIRTPLNGVIGMTELALETNLEAERREFLGTASSSAHSLMKVLNDILDFSKIEAGRLELEPVEFHLSRELALTLKSFASEAGAKGLELVLSVEAGAPEWVLSDPDRLRQVVMNLLANAIKFTDAGEVVLGVKPERLGEQDPGLHFTVSDTGIGVPKDKQDFIFQAFRQADGSTTRQYGGTGLGLAISSHLVEMLGGRLWVESEPGEGSAFHFTIRAGLAATRPQAAPPFLAGLKGLRVLVVDDSAASRRVVRECTRGWGMSPGEANGGRAALDMLRQARREGEPFRLVILDATMPEMDGFELAERIESQPELRATVVLMLTSGELRSDAGRTRAAGIAHYVVKPVTAADLLQAITSAWDFSGDRDQLREPPSPVTSPAPEMAPLSILLAEDNVVNQRLAIRLLEGEGHRVSLAVNGQEALRALAREDFDLVLMDIQMPKMDGLEATRTIRENEKLTGAHVPVVAMTAHAMKGDREKCLAAGMDGYVSKPVSKAELLRAIRGVSGLEEAAAVEAAAGPVKEG